MKGEPTFASELKNRLSYDDCVALIDDFENTCDAFGIAGRLIFTGGDPLLREDFFELLAYAKGKGKFEINVLGNPYHVTPEIANRLREHGVSSYQISIDGLEATHDKFRRRGSFKSSLSALRILKSAGIRTAVMTTVSRENMDELIQVIELVANENVDLFNFDRVAFVGNGKQLSGQQITPAEYRALLLDVLKKYKDIESHGIKTKFGMKDRLWMLLLYELNQFDISKHPSDAIVTGCTMGIGALSVLADGTVYACRKFPSPIGKVPEQKLLDIFLDSKAVNDYRDVEKLEKCSKCELLRFCRGCPAVAYGATGNWRAPDPQCWK